METPYRFTPRTTGRTDEERRTRVYSTNFADPDRLPSTEVEDSITLLVMTLRARHPAVINASYDWQRYELTVTVSDPNDWCASGNNAEAMIFMWPQRLLASIAA